MISFVWPPGEPMLAGTGGVPKPTQLGILESYSDVVLMLKL